MIKSYLYNACLLTDQDQSPFFQGYLFVFCIKKLEYTSESVFISHLFLVNFKNINKENLKNYL